MQRAAPITDEMQVFVHGPASNSRSIVTLDEKEPTVAALRLAIERKTGQKADAQFLMFGCKALLDHYSLADVGSTFLRLKYYLPTF